MGGSSRNVTGNIPGPGTQLISSANSRISLDYVFEPQQRLIIVKDKDFVRILYAINVTKGQIIYNPLDPGKDGSQTARNINLEYNTIAMEKSDDLCIVYEAARDDEVKIMLEQLVKGQETTNELLCAMIEF